MLLRLTVKEMILQKKTTEFELDLGIKVTQDVAKYPLHHVTYAHVKFEVATSRCLGGVAIARIHYMTLIQRSHGLGGDAFTRKFII